MYLSVTGELWKLIDRSVCVYGILRKTTRGNYSELNVHRCLNIEKEMLEKEKDISPRISLFYFKKKTLFNFPT